MERDTTRAVSIVGLGGLLVFSLAIFILTATLFGLKRQSNNLVEYSLFPTIGQKAGYQIGNNSWTIQQGEWVYRSGILKSITDPASIVMKVEGEEVIEIVAFALEQNTSPAAVTISLGDPKLEESYRFEHSENGRLAIYRTDSTDTSDQDLAWVQTNTSPFEAHQYSIQVNSDYLIVELDGEKVIEISNSDPIPVTAVRVIAEGSSIAVAELR